MTLRWLYPLLPLPLVGLLGAWASAQVAERAGAAGANALSVVAALARQPATATSATPDDGLVIPTNFVEPAPLALPAVASPPPSKGKHRGKAAPPAGPMVLFVSKDRVLGLAATGARPHGVPVPASGARPPGLRLSGVSALGIGVAEGDVLTRAVGQPALSSGAVINAVLVARAHHAAVLDGELWRGNQRYLLRVEQPYLSGRRAETDDAEPAEAAPTESAQSDAPRVTVTLVPRTKRL